MPPEPPSDIRLSAITGFSLVTADLSRLRKFYRETLGFACVEPERMIARHEMDLLGVSGGGRRQELRLGAQVLTIDQFETPGRAYPQDSDAASLSFQHLALVVTDMAEAYRRIEGCLPITQGGPQHLPRSSGGVTAFKFRDPDGHPLELLQFPAQAGPLDWRNASTPPGHIGPGIDHSAISVSDIDASVDFYRNLGLHAADRSINRGTAQTRLDHLADVDVTVEPMVPDVATPHLELLGYRVPRASGDRRVSNANDVCATRIVWRGTGVALLRDPDGHLHQVTRE